MAPAESGAGHLLKHLQLPLRRAGVEPRSQRAQVMMVANALQFNALAVDEHAFIRIELQRADAERRFTNIQNFPVLHNRRDRDVAVWFLRRRRPPKFWVRSEERRV